MFQWKCHCWKIYGQFWYLRIEVSNWSIKSLIKESWHLTSHCRWFLFIYLLMHYPVLFTFQVTTSSSSFGRVKSVLVIIFRWELWCNPHYQCSPSHSQDPHPRRPSRSDFLSPERQHGLHSAPSGDRVYNSLHK